MPIAVPMSRARRCAGGFTSLPPIDWAKPEPEVVEPLVKAVDGMSDGEKRGVSLRF
jgi:hypothetical protein